MTLGEAAWLCSMYILIHTHNYMESFVSVKEFSHDAYNYIAHSRAEVGLLSHNVIVQGSRPPPSVDQDAVDPQYGSQIFVHRTGTHPTPVRYTVVSV